MECVTFAIEFGILAIKFSAIVLEFVTFEETLATTNCLF